MPYLPEVTALQTVFPKIDTRDFEFQLRLIDEQYERMYPRIAYVCLKKAVTVTAVTASGDRTPVGEAGTTTFDPIWGEAIAPGAVAWLQPHATVGDVVATDVEQYADPVTVNARIQRITKETQIKKYGFDKVRDLTLFIPLSILDRVGVTCKHGDKFTWNSYEYEVLELNTQGYWKNTDVALYMALNCEQRRRGA